MDTVKDQSGISLYRVSVVHQLPRGQHSGRRLQDQIRSDVPMSTWKLGHQRTQSFSQCMKFTGYCLRINWTHSLPSMPLLNVTVCLSSAATERRQPGRCSNNITLILLALGRALSQKISWHHQKHSFLDLWCAWRWFMQQSTSKAILQRSIPKRLPPTTDTEVPYHACTLSSNYMESSSPAMAILSATYAQSLQGVHFMWVYKGVPQPTLQLQVCMYNRLY